MFKEKVFRASTHPILLRAWYLMPLSLIKVRAWFGPGFFQWQHSPCWYICHQSLLVLLPTTGAAAPVLWETQCRRAGSCHHGEQDYFSASLGWGSTPETVRASSAGPATREKSCHGTSYKHSPGYFKHLNNEIYNHGFQSGKTLEQAKMSMEVRVGAKRATWPQHVQVSTMAAFLCKKQPLDIIRLLKVKVNPPVFFHFRCFVGFF